MNVSTWLRDRGPHAPRSCRRVGPSLRVTDERAWASSARAVPRLPRVSRGCWLRSGDPGARLGRRAIARVMPPSATSRPRPSSPGSTPLCPSDHLGIDATVEVE